jgi:hypothetical protein
MACLAWRLNILRAMRRHYDQHDGAFLAWMDVVIVAAV